MEYQDQIETLFYEFLWQGKHKIVKHVIEQKIDDGGLNMPNIYIKIKACQLAWVKRLIINENSSLVSLLNGILEDISINYQIKCSDLSQISIHHKLPNFYRQILLVWVI